MTTQKTRRKKGRAQFGYTRQLPSGRWQASYVDKAGVRRLTGSALSFDPSFPVEGSMSVPKSHENRPLGIATLFEKSLEVPSETVLESV